MRAILSALVPSILVLSVQAAPKPSVDQRYPYTGPKVPVGDWVDPKVNGNGKGFPRLVEPPAVTPAKKKPSNNINVIQLSYLPDGMNIHYQTPFGLGKQPSVQWGAHPSRLNHKVAGHTRT